VVTAAHAGPAITSLPPVRRLLPGLCGVGRAGHVALTFDDGPDPDSTPSFLAALDRLGWRATFFMLGEQVRAHPAVAAEVARAGHEIALHGQEHRSHLARGPVAVADDLRRSLALLTEATGRRPRWYRPPYGIVAGGTLLACRSLGLRPVLWTAWGRDWRAEATARTVLDDIAAGVLSGGTVLLHDSDCTSAPGSWRAALDALPGLAAMCAERGLVVGPLAEHGLSGRFGGPATRPKSPRNRPGAAGFRRPASLVR